MELVIPAWLVKIVATIAGIAMMVGGISSLPISVFTNQKRWLYTGIAISVAGLALFLWGIVS